MTDRATPEPALPAGYGTDRIFASDKPVRQIGQSGQVPETTSLSGGAKVLENPVGHFKLKL
ncbi:hypothetical protein SAE02_78440 [Skermanella aerolata]|uniref:Uncharacterized protein n=1 Tax=Skermanella aerolata TaxID=393310 RepID=A0A512E4N1_9PROT|nr:hypothetical protein [Skermanella aerolata]GEO43696.1 hypothetical protein SAE02_78440 [Skermanella aerolata]